jgi:hypothetical protein
LISFLGIYPTDPTWIIIPIVVLLIQQRISITDWAVAVLVIKMRIEWIAPSANYVILSAAIINGRALNENCILHYMHIAAASIAFGAV